MDTKNYSLEKHLEAICTADDDYKLLLSAWRLNKENLPNALSTIASYFPNYSKHDDTHSMTLLDNIQRMLGRDRIEKLGATDTFLILMAALTHDLGMYMSYTFLEEEWGKPEMEDLLKKYAEHSDKQIARAAKLLLNHKRDSDDPAKGFKWALEMRNAVTLIIAHQMRGGHEDRSKKYLDKKDDLFAKLAHDFYCDAFPSRYLSLLADVAHLHGTKFDEVMTLLNHKADGLKGDMAHPRFIACMIRLGDLLDVDSNRFNPFSLATLKELPESSEAHYDKHNAVKHLLISPDGIEAELDCPTDASFRIARELFDMLQQEVEKQSQNWNRIAPQDLGGLPPVLHQDKIIISYKGSKTRPELRNLRFDISGQRTFEMLKGGAIYKKPGRVFIREIVQNALDATKLQIWKDMDYYLPYHLDNPGRDIKCVDDIKFTSDIPSWVYEKYPVHLNVDYDEDKQVVRVVCEDNGTGISEESLIRMTSQVGASRKADKSYNDTIKQMPYFLQPTAAFGLGLQTVFYVTDEFTVKTQYPGEPTREIIFRSSVDGNYCSEIEGVKFERQIEGTKKKKPVTHGTTLIIEIDKSHFVELFEISKDQIEELDKDPSSFKYYISTKIDSYVKFYFSGTSFVPINYKSSFLLQKLGTKDAFRDKIYIHGEKFFRVYRYGNEGEPHYCIEENVYGTVMDIFFPQDTLYLIRENNVFLKGVRIFTEDNANRIYIEWNLLNRESDQLVTISRDNLLPKGYEWLENARNNLMPDVIRLIYRNLYNECNNCSNIEIKQKMLKQYFNYCMINWKLSEPINVDFDILNGLILDKKLFGKTEGKEVNASDLIKASVLFTCSDPLMLDLSKKMDKLSKDSCDWIYITEPWLIPDCYKCVIIHTGKDGFLYQLEKLNKPNPILVELKGSWSYYYKNHNFVYTFSYYEESSYIKNCFHGFKEYDKIVVGGDAPLLEFDKPYHGNCWIYPFGSLTMEDSELGRERLLVKLKGGYVKDLVPDYLLKLIQKYRVLKDDKITDEEIYDEYIRMILDFTFGADKKKGENKNA